MCVWARQAGSTVSATINNKNSGFGFPKPLFYLTHPPIPLGIISAQSLRIQSHLSKSLAILTKSFLRGAAIGRRDRTPHVCLAPWGEVDFRRKAERRRGVLICRFPQHGDQQIGRAADCRPYRFHHTVGADIIRPLAHNTHSYRFIMALSRLSVITLTLMSNTVASPPKYSSLNLVSFSSTFLSPVQIT